MKVSEGDHLVIESERVGQPPRTGTIEEVISLDPLRLRVRWENNRESIRQATRLDPMSPWSSRTSCN